MKRILIFAVLTIMAAGLSVAQSSGVSEQSRSLPSSRNVPASSAPASREAGEPQPKARETAPSPAPAAQPAKADAAAPTAQAAPASAPKPAPAKAAGSSAAQPAPARAASTQTAPAQRSPAVPVVVQPIITNPPVVNNHYYGKVYNPPQAQSQSQAPAPTTIIIPIPVPATPTGTQTVSPQAVPAAPVSPNTALPGPASAALPRRDPNTGYIIPAGPPRRTIRGLLGVERGMVTLTDAYEVKWFIMGLERYIGLIEGLNIGEEAEIKGYAPSASSAARERFFQPATLILEGAEYDIGPLSAATKAGALPQDKLSQQKGAAAQTAPQAQAAQPVQSAPVQTAGGFQYLPIQPIVIQPAPQAQPPREEKYIPWTHVHTSPWSPHYGAVGQDIDTSSFWTQNDGVWW